MEVGFLSVEILCFLILLSTVSYADINLGSSLKPTSNQNNNSIWRSPNGNFSLQFISVSSSSFSVAITFTGVPIWKAGGESGVVDSNARFQFLNDGNLRLINGSGTIIWEANTTKLGITVATLDDSGNLSLKKRTTTVWSTFDNPTDTIVPFQNFTTRNVLSSGNYSFAFNSSGYLSLRWNSDAIYWNGWNSLLSSTLTTPILRILPIGMIQINGISIFYSNDFVNTGEDSSILRFIKLDSDGNLRIYSSVRGTGKAIERWAAVSDQCQVYGFCGNMGICSYKEDSNPSCVCPSEHFEFTDKNDTGKGCKRKVETEDCPGNTIMLKLDHTQFLTYAPELSTQVFYASLSGCSLNCLNNNRGPCRASTAVLDGSGLCYFKTSSFNSGYKSPALPSVSFVKVCGPPIQTYKLHVWAFVMIVFVTLVVLVLLEGGLWFWCCRNSS